MKPDINILYVDDEENNLVAFKANFRKDYTIYVADSAEKGILILKETDIHIIITDQRMPKVTGVEFLESVITDHPDAIRIILTGYSDINIIIDAINKGQVFRYLMKPFNEVELKLAIENAIEVYLLRKKNKELIEKLITVNSQLEFVLRQKLIS